MPSWMRRQPLRAAPRSLVLAAGAVLGQGKDGHTHHVVLALAAREGGEVLVGVVWLVVLHVGGAVVFVLAKQESGRVGLVKVEVVEAGLGPSDRH